MFYQQHTVDTKNQLAFSEVLRQGTNYPIGMTVDNYLDFISDVKTLKANISLNVTPLASFTPTSSLQDILAQIAILGIEQGFTSTIINDSIRQILPIGRINADFSPVTGLSATSSLADAPYFFFKGFPGFALIDCTKSKFNSGLIYPFILISLSVNIGSDTGLLPLSTISFGNYGNIPIYGPADLLIQNSIVLGGSIEIKDRFSDIKISSQNVSKSQSVTFTGLGMKDLSGFNRAFLNEARLDVQASPDTLIIEIPIYAKTGCVRFEQQQPVYNTFLTDKIIIS